MVKRSLLYAVLAGLTLPAAALSQTKDAPMRFPPPEPQQPITWGILSRYVPEKSAPGDPIAEASKKLAVAGGVVFRPTPAAYVRTTVPDLFENRHLLRMPATVPEEPMLPLLFPRK